MNIVQRAALAPATATYAWLITRDHLAATGESSHAAGVSGPHNAPSALLERLNAGAGHTFRLYDDDGELYYTGRAIWTTYPADPDEDAAYGPLADFGAGWAGCTLVKWHDKPAWDCG